MSGGRGTAPVETHSSFDRRELRNALGSFATGVTIITTCKPSGEKIGLTANSFNSVSLDPPLVIWSLATSSSSLTAFQDSTYYAINILSLNQAGLAQHFATPQADKFAGIAWQPGLGGAPLLEGCAAHFECRNEFRHYGGDHMILLGHVERFSHAQHAPLLFCRGQYHASHPIRAIAPVITAEDGDQSDWAGIG